MNFETMLFFTKNDVDIGTIDFVDIAQKRLARGYGCEKVVRREPNTEGIDLEAIVHGLFLRFRVMVIVGNTDGHISWIWDPEQKQPLLLRFCDFGDYYALKYEYFPLTEKPTVADDSGFYMADSSMSSIRFLLAEGKTGGLGYDMENIVDMASNYGPAFLDETLTLLEQLGINVDREAHAPDKEGFCAVQLHRNNKELCEVFKMHGVSLDWVRAIPSPDSDIYELVTERETINSMEKIARKWHDGQFRKDGKTPYINHPAAVAAMVKKWGFEPECDGWVVAVAWAHDLIEESPIERREEVEHDIYWATKGQLGEQKRMLDAVRLLSRDKKEFPNKADYILHVAMTASQPVLAVKIADRICNTLDFLQLSGAGIEKARMYFAEGGPLFAHLGKTTYSCERLGLATERQIREEIEKTKAILENPTEKTLA